MFSNKSNNEKYSRQIILDEIGEKGQSKLRNASVLVVGCGGLGSPVLYYLTAAGIGHLGINDGDTVILSNLNRQILYTQNDIGKKKVDMAKKRLEELNEQLTVTVYGENLDKPLAERIVKDYDVVVDCLDNFETRFILNDACINAKKPLIHAGVNGFDGQLMTVLPGDGPCLRCLFPDGIKKTPANQSGVIGPLPGIIGSMQALEAIKQILGLQTNNDGLILFDGKSLKTEKVKIKQSKNCICVSRGRFS